MNISPNGNRMIAGIYGGETYTSTDTGANWSILSYFSKNWNALAINNDGTKVFGCADDGIYISLNYVSAPSWILVANTSTMGPFYTISIFNDGNGLIIGGSSIYMTKDTSTLAAGLTVVTSLPSGCDWRSSVSSSDGTYLAVGDYSSQNGIYISNDSGGSWSQQISTKNHKHSQMSASSNCNIICSCVYQGDVFIIN